ncbi:HEAT repeat domain-containing protein, partial [bacterium]|nr:HEAT repeat domain-containing protein [bacterium]
ARPAVPALIKLLRDKRWGVRANAAKALAKIAPDAEGVVAALRKRLKDRDARVRKAVKEAIELICGNPLE